MVWTVQGFPPWSPPEGVGFEPPVIDGVCFMGRPLGPARLLSSKGKQTGSPIGKEEDYFSNMPWNQSGAQIISGSVLSLGILTPRMTSTG